MRAAYPEAAASAAALLADPAVAAAWQAPSALEKLTVGGLAAHLARQITGALEVLAAEPRDEDPISLSDHYVRSRWVGADLDEEVNVGVRRRGEQDATIGVSALVDRVNTALGSLRDALPAEPAGRGISTPPLPAAVLDPVLALLTQVAVRRHGQTAVLRALSRSERAPATISAL
jgi:hypothetical protein